MRERFVLSQAGPDDMRPLAELFFRSFSVGTLTQVPFFAKMFPPNSPTTVDFFANSFSEQMKREAGKSHFIKVVDTEHAESKIVGFAKWTPPQLEESFWADYAPDMDAALCDEFFGAMATHREKLMGDRPHWYLELLGVDAQYHKQGIGSQLVHYGCDLIDKDGVESYVDSSPAATRLYEKFGFVEKDRQVFEKPWDWYNEVFMVRSACDSSSASAHRRRRGGLLSTFISAGAGAGA